MKLGQRFLSNNEAHEIWNIKRMELVELMAFLSFAPAATTKGNICTWEEKKGRIFNT